MLFYDINNLLNHLSARFLDTLKKEHQPYMLYCMYRHTFMPFIDRYI